MDTALPTAHWDFLVRLGKGKRLLGGKMRRFAIGCAVAAFIALSAEPEAVSVALLENNISAFNQAMPPQVGVASWYGEECEGNPTASGELFDMNGLTAAQWELPFGTRIRVTNLTNNRSLVLRVNDRGPGIPGRIVDVSMEAAKRLGFKSRGLVQVQLDVLDYHIQWNQKPASLEGSGEFMDVD